MRRAVRSRYSSRSSSTRLSRRSVLPATNKKPTVLSMEEVRRGLVPYTDLAREEAEALLK